ncbi:MAG TPA: hypothetical protein VL547_02460 [Dinghuibacter sp.]|uniref:hypothetical protein n=1 Tax=Dinghuibacter sp. TaxID=2024697 RepID=UPI002C96D4D5|nr:hypothetical protein [Dinghuibacter sp.]HTJ10855.1 hypothetical protein [Dinghuibacter sp.]
MTRRILYTALLMGAISLQLRAQDQMYLKSGKINEWKVTAITPTDIQGNIPANPGVPYSTARSNVLFIFNRIGNFLVIPTLNDADPKYQRFKDNFFSGASDAYGKEDRIITTNNDIITGKYTGVDGNSITYTAQGKDGKIATSDIVVIIFMNGDHKIYSSTNKAFQVLNAIEQQFNDLAFGTAAPAGANGPVVTPVAAATPPPADDKSKKKRGKHDKDAPPVAATTQPQPTQPTPPPAPKPDTADLALTDDQMDQLSAKAIQKAKDFGYYLQEACNKDADMDQLNAVIARALTLFIDDDRVIEVAGPNGAKVQKKIKDYMNHLRFLSYDKVTIQWYNVQFVNKFRKGPDGNYYGEIEFEQKFTAYTGDNFKAYGDITRKKTEVVLKPVTVEKNGIAERHWDVLLGDIGVAEIKTKA